MDLYAHKSAFVNGSVTWERIQRRVHMVTFRIVRRNHKKTTGNPYVLILTFCAVRSGGSTTPTLAMRVGR